MTSIDLTVDGDEQLAQSLAAAADRLVDLEPVNRDAGREVLEAADIPVRTGYLASRAEVAASRDGFTLTDDAPYALTVHARNPFFTRAMDAKQQRVIDRLADHVDDTLNTVTGA